MIAVVSPNHGSRAVADDNGDAHGLPRFGLRLPVAWLDTYGRRRHVGPLSQEFSPAGFPPQAGTPTGIPRPYACGAKIRGSCRGAALRLPSAPPLAGFGSVPSSRP